MMPNVCVVGEINPDLIFYGLPADLKPEQEILASGFRFTLGSSSAIFAHNLAALGTSVGMASKVGADVFGKQCVGWLRDAKVDTSRVVPGANSRAKQGEHATGLTVVLAQEGQRYILTYPGAMSSFAYEDIDLKYVLTARHLHLSSFYLHRSLRPRIADLFKRAKRKGLTTSLDPNDDPANKWHDDLFEVLKYVDIFFPNEREAEKIAKRENLADAIRELSKRVRTVVVKLGAKGAIAVEGGREYQVAPVKVNAVDAVGAGDSFDAGFLHQFLKGAGIENCLNYAAMAGAYSTTGQGGVEAFRDRKRLKEFMRQKARSR
jgi:sugar/nucleoside kinase (ribokinase family)